MERSFSQFGHLKRFRIDSALGLDDQQVQIDELDDIESFMPDMRLEIIEPKPADIGTLRDSLRAQEREWPLGFHLFSKVEVNEELHDLNFEVFLPENYPSLDDPIISFSCDSLSSATVEQLTLRLEKHIRQNAASSGLLLDCIAWVQQHVAHAIQHKNRPFSEIEFVPVLR